MGVRCTECGAALVEEADGELLRHMGASQKRRLLWAMYTYAATTVVMPALILGFLIMMMLDSMFSQIDITGYFLTLMLFGMLASFIACLVGAWLVSHADYTRERHVSLIAKCAIAAAACSPPAHIVAFVSSSPAVVMRLVYCMIVIAIGSFLWTQSGIVNGLWGRTGLARYRRGARRRRSRAALLCFRVVVISWTALAFADTLLLNDELDTFRVTGLAPLGMLVLVAMGPVMLTLAAKDVKDEFLRQSHSTS